MARRQISQNTPRWPAVSSYADLPNVAGSPMQSPQLEVGDTCFVSTLAWLFICRNATLGAAVWAVLGPADHQTSKIIVGNALAGDTLDVCDFLDPGDGSGITAALNAILLLPYQQVDIAVRPGVYTIPNGTIFGLAAGVTLTGAGKGATVFVVPPGAAGIEPWRLVLLVGQGAGISNLTMRATSVNTAGASGSLSGIIDVLATRTFVRNVDFEASGTLTISSTFWSSLVRANISPVDALDVSDCSVYAGASDATWSFGGFFTFSLVGSDAAVSVGWLGATPKPTFRNLYVRGQTGANRFFAGVYMRGFAAFDLDTLTTTSCQFAVFCRYRGATATIGPVIRNVTAQIDAITGHAGVSVSVQSAVAGTSLDGVLIEGVRCYWPGLAGALMYPVSIFTNLATTVAPITNVVVRDVEAVRATANGTVRVEVINIGTAAPIENVLLAGVRLPAASSIIILGAAAGVGSVVDAAIDHARCADLTLSANMTNTIVGDSRITNAFTDSAVGTSQANLIIGP